MIGVILPAAGSSVRFGSDKLSANLCGKTVLWQTLNRFQQAKLPEKIVLVTRSDRLADVRKIAEKFSKVSAVVAGGKTRQDSVFNGLRALPENVDFVAVHDAARPLISSEEIDRLCREALPFPAAVTVCPVADTIHCETDGFLSSTPDRSHLFAAQTPQFFHREIYDSARKKTSGIYTDEASLLAACGVPVRLLVSTCENRKITLENDLRYAEFLMKEGRL